MTKKQKRLDNKSKWEFNQFLKKYFKKINKK